MIGFRWVIYDGDDSGTLHEVNPTTGAEWTANDALNQEEWAQADGGNVIALLVVDAWDSAYYVEDNVLMVAPLLVDGRPALEDAVAVDLDHARSGGEEIDWVVEQFVT